MIIFILIVIASGCTPALHKAARDNDVNKIDLLLHKSHRVDELFDNGYGYTPLHYAAANGSMTALEYLLKKGADINARGSANITPLHAACGLLVPMRPGNGLSEAAIYLINRGADSFIIDGFSHTPIHYASANGRLDVIKAFLNKGVDIDIGNGTIIGTPLHSAFQLSTPIQQALTTADYLIKNGADINATSADGSPPYMAQHQSLASGSNSWLSTVPISISLIIKEKPLYHSLKPSAPMRCHKKTRKRRGPQLKY